MDYLVSVLYQVLVLSNLVLSTAKLGSGAPLSEYIRHYEPVYYDHEELHRAHQRARRSSPTTHLHLSFDAHGRKFNLRLRRDTGVFHPEMVVETSEGTLYYDTSKAYVGHLSDDTGSRVHGVITSTGVFEGKIMTSDEETYMVERSFRHFSSPQVFHSVIYRHSDVHMPSLNSSLCASDALHAKLRRLQAIHGRTGNNKHTSSSSSSSSTSEHPPLQLRPGASFNVRLRNGSAVVPFRDWRPGDTYSTEPPTGRGRSHEPPPGGINHYHSASSGSFGGDDGHKQQSHKPYHRRHKRAIDPTKTTCTLFVQADHLFYQKFHSNTETVIEQLTQHVQGVNDIYRPIDFDGDAIPDSINFIIKRIKVHTESTASGYKFAGNYGVETFLELFSEDSFDAFCLAYMFTYRDFEGGTLGLAWTGDLQNAGGVCEKNGQFRGSLKSLNSGIVTILNYGKDVPSTVSHVTMAHEIGHNMGSQHDPETMECSPGGDTGNYIMFARATSGDKPNNNKFSACSKASMATVMEAKARHTSGCFIAPTSSICGNEVVEAGEECDCGWEDECLDQCCYPQTSNELTLQRPCSRRPGAACSPSEGPCCTEYCAIIGPPMNSTCRAGTSCKSAAYCDGSGPGCPFSRQRLDKTPCDDGYVCYQGECTGSICMAYELESCQCEPSDPNDFSHPDLCKLCCKMPGDGYPCMSSFEWNLPPYDVPDLMAKPGMPCNNYRGYCDVFHECREVDPEGPLSDLKKLLFSSEGLSLMKDWLTKNWYILLSGVLGFVMLVALIVRLCRPRKKIVKTPIIPVKPPTPVNTGGVVVANTNAQSTTPQSPTQPWKKRSTRKTAQSPTSHTAPSVHTGNSTYNTRSSCTGASSSSLGTKSPLFPSFPYPGYHSSHMSSGGGGGPVRTSHGGTSVAVGSNMTNASLGGLHNSSSPPGPNYQDYLRYSNDYPSFSAFYPTRRKSQEGWV